MIGRTITDLRRMTDDEMDQEGWYVNGENPAAVELDDGTVLYPSRDPEGNGPGALFGYDDDGAIMVHPTLASE